MCCGSIESVLKHLRDKFPEFVFEEKLPKYVLSLNPSVSGIHCYKKVDHFIPIAKNSFYPDAENNDTNIAEISGNPLTQQFESLNVSATINDILGTDPFLLGRGPIDNNTARSIINFVSMRLNTDCEISVLSEGHKFKKIVMGFYKRQCTTCTWWIDVLPKPLDTIEMLQHHQKEAGHESRVETFGRWTKVLKGGESSVLLIVERAELVLNPPEDYKTSASVLLNVRPNGCQALRSIWRQLELLRTIIKLIDLPEDAEVPQWQGIHGLIGHTEMTPQNRFRHVMALRVRPANFNLPPRDIVEAAAAFASRHFGPLDNAWLLLAESKGERDLGKLVGLLYSVTQALRSEGGLLIGATEELKAAASLAGKGGIQGSPIELFVELGALKLRRELNRVLNAIAGPILPSPPPLFPFNNILLWLYQAAATLELLSALENCVDQNFLSHVAVKTLLANMTSHNSQITIPWERENLPNLMVTLPVPISKLSKKLDIWHEVFIKLSSSFSHATITSTFLFSTINLLPTTLQPTTIKEDVNHHENDTECPETCCLKMTSKEFKLIQCNGV